MNSSMEFHKVWIEQCAATEDIREQFGSKSAQREPDDLVGVDDETMEEPWPDHPVPGAQELLRFFRVRELLQQ